MWFQYHHVSFLKEIPQTEVHVRLDIAEKQCVGLVLWTRVGHRWVCRKVLDPMVSAQQLKYLEWRGGSWNQWWSLTAAEGRLKPSHNGRLAVGYHCQVVAPTVAHGSPSVCFHRRRRVKGSSDVELVGLNINGCGTGPGVADFVGAFLAALLLLPLH